MKTPQGKLRGISKFNFADPSGANLACLGIAQRRRVSNLVTNLVHSSTPALLLYTARGQSSLQSDE